MVILIVASALQANSQPIPVNNQFLLNKYSLSPAFAGKQDNFQSYMTYRQNWMGLQGAPENIILNLDGSIFDNAGFGLNFTTEKIGIFKDISFSGSYAYHLIINDANCVDFGLTGTYFRNYIHVDNTKSTDLSDPVIEANQSLSAGAFNTSFGFGYNHKSFDAGIVFSNILNNKLDNNQIIYTSPREFKTYLMYSFRLKPRIFFEPTISSSITNEYKFLYSFSGKLKLYDDFWTGIIFRRSSTLGFDAGFRLYNNFEFTYCYEFSNREFLLNSRGTHEVTIGFKMDKDKKVSIETIKAKRQYFFARMKNFLKKKWIF